MSVAAIARLAVPTGTAAAVVVMREPTGDPTMDARRFAALAALDDTRYRAAFEELVVSGVYTILSERVLVLRVSSQGVKSYAVAVSIAGARAATSARAGLCVHSAEIAARTDSDELRTLLEAETKQRPIFHGMTAEGTTYSGFDAKESAAILAAAAAALPDHPPAAHVALLFAGQAIEVPPGLVIGVLPAPF